MVSGIFWISLPASRPHSNKPVDSVSRALQLRTDVFRCVRAWLSILNKVVIVAGRMRWKRDATACRLACFKACLASTHDAVQHAAQRHV